MNIDHEIVIVGAGPAGSIAAISLAQKGHDVLLVDKCQFPRDKPCGDFIAPLGIQILNNFGLGKKIKKANFYPIDGVRIASPKHQTLDISIQTKDTDSKFIIAPRYIFDSILVSYALEHGVKFLKAKAENPIIENKTIIGLNASTNEDQYKINSRVLIGADGSNSTIARSLNQTGYNDNYRVIAIRAYIDDLEIFPNKIEACLCNEIWPGYVWIFPLGGTRANIGLGILLSQFKQKTKSLNKMLSDFVNSPIIKKRLHFGGQIKNISIRPLNLGWQKQLKRSHNGALLVGDAAALINPLSGGGIVNAMLSGQIAADVLHDCLNKNDVSEQALNKYEVYLQKSLRRELYRSYLSRKILFSSPLLIDTIIKTISRNRFIPHIINSFYNDIEFSIK